MNTLVFGGQYGSEGKGAFLAHLAQSRSGYTHTVRGGGPQAGHTFWKPDVGVVKVRQVPVGAHFGLRAYIGPGAVIDPAVILQELGQGHGLLDVSIHPHAYCVTEDHRKQERMLAASGSIPGSTCEGTGAARSRRVMRLDMYEQQKHLEALGKYIDHGLVEYRGLLRAYQLGQVLIEGCQGFGLSLYHGELPYTTSGDTTPPAILSECGLPLVPRPEVIAVVRTYPIRVGGASGPLDDEISFDELKVPPEYTTVTHKMRRIGRHQITKTREMIRICQPDAIALSFVDYLDIETTPGRTFEQVFHSDALQRWLMGREDLANRVEFLGIGGPHFDYLSHCKYEEFISCSSNIRGSAPSKPGTQMPDLIS